MSNRVSIRLPFRVPNVGAWKKGIGQVIEENRDWLPMFAAALLGILLSFIIAAKFDPSKLIPWKNF